MGPPELPPLSEASDEELLLIRGPGAIVVDLDGAWAKSNLTVGGCKHDIFREDHDKLGMGLAVRCAKCGCVIVSRETASRLAAEVQAFDG